MELFTNIALTVGVFVLVAVSITATLMVKTDVFTRPRPAQRPHTPLAHPAYEATREVATS